MRAFRPSRFGENDAREALLVQMDAKEERIPLYGQRAREGLPVTDTSEETGSWPEVRMGHDAGRKETGYRIIWEHKATGRVVIGQYEYPSGEVACAVARAMDVLWPEIRHRALRAKEAAAVRGECGRRDGVVAAYAGDGGF